MYIINYIHAYVNTGSKKESDRYSRYEIRNKNKKTSQKRSLLIRTNVLVRLVDYRWNHIYVSLMLMYESW